MCNVGAGDFNCVFLCAGIEVKYIMLIGEFLTVRFMCSCLNACNTLHVCVYCIFVWVCMCVLYVLI